MTDEALINRLYDVVDEITRIGGEQERTSITPGILVADANPNDLPTGYIKIVNPRDGGYVPCLTVNGLVVSDNDLVNVLFTKGTEPIALSQSSNSPSNTLKVSEVWESDFGAVALQADADGDIGIGTASPISTLHLSHANFPGMTFEDLNEALNEKIWQWIGNAGSLEIRTRTDANGAGQTAVSIERSGTTVTEANFPNGNVGIGTTGPDAKLDVLDTAGAQLRLTHTDGSKFVDFTLDTNHDLTITPSSTGQVIFQPTTDSTDFLQVLDADGGTPILNIDSTNERVGIGTASPINVFHLSHVNFPGMTFEDLDEAADEKIWQWIGNGGALDIRTRTDANGAGQTAMSVERSGTTVTEVNFPNGDVGIGVASPQGKLHGYDDIAGFLYWKYDGLDGTTRTVLPNGTGDVLYRLIVDYIIRSSAPALAAGSTQIDPGGSVGVGVGADTVTIAVAANGAVTTSRTAGASTHKVVYRMFWL